MSNIEEGILNAQKIMLWFVQKTTETIIMLAILSIITFFIVTTLSMYVVGVEETKLQIRELTKVIYKDIYGDAVILHLYIYGLLTDRDFLRILIAKLWKQTFPYFAASLEI